MNKKEFYRAIAWLEKHISEPLALARLATLKAQGHTLRPEHLAPQIAGVIALECVEAGIEGEPPPEFSIWIDVGTRFDNAVPHEAVSELKIMKSAAGYYVGRSYQDEESGGEFPYSRESGYFRTRAEAERSIPRFE